MKISKGQTLYREKQRPRRQRYDQPFVRQVEEVVVETVGSKYFTLAGDSPERYLKNTLKGEYSGNRLHLTAQEITDEWTRADLQRQVGRVFEWHVPVPLATLRQIAALLPDQLAILATPLP